MKLSDLPLLGMATYIIFFWIVDFNHPGHIINMILFAGASAFLLAVEE